MPSISPDTLERIRNISDAELEDLHQRAKKSVHAFQAAELADLNVARYEPSSYESDHVIERGMAQTSRARALLNVITTEIERRKANA